ncbi:FeoA family protein [Limisalsivibrio acetivorans]|uniref:FeoA family protein n=1 Tax=Limisalsivibrio acetivorans TaxID=1304888 RepID=UPI0003B6A42F|nr:FeoA family protein [Limisalsivibrio acetivorans]
MDKCLRLMQSGEKGRISRIEGHGEVARRIRDMGVGVGCLVKIVGRAPLKDPVAIKVNNNTITLRNNEADYIFVEDAEL